MAYKIVLDPGHGGSDWGASFEGRKEKDDVLNLAFAVGQILENAGIDVEYTRTTDVYNTPFEKATMGNNADADFFVSFHRNATATPGQGSGIETLVYDDSGIKAEMARNINENLEELGWTNRGVIERPNLVVLKRTKMPALLVEAGFIDNPNDNEKFDEQFNEIAEAIADGILDTLDMGDLMETPLYRVQVGAYDNADTAASLSMRLNNGGFPAYVVSSNGIYRVQVGAFANLANAVAMENRLRNAGFTTFITT
ncbi:MAG: N-acetylmuramoyl-L-alanine amidase [Lachnospiraceae bacterium]